MIEQTDAKPEQMTTSTVYKAPPYEGVLLKAFDRLTSEIFIFLLAYVILIIGLSFFNVAMTNTLITLLYLIPILGVVSYAWLRQRALVNDAKEHGVNVKEGVRVDIGLYPAVPQFTPSHRKGRLIGQKPPLKPREVWAIRIRLQKQRK